MDKKIKPLCVAPWHVLNIENRGNFNICCHIDQGAKKNPVTSVTAEQWASSPEMKEIRKKFLNQEMPDVCFRCVREETWGKFSLRKKLNNTFYDSNFDYREDNYSMRKLQIDLGNLCNYKCVSCAPYQSTQIASDYKKVGWYGKNYPKYLTNDRVESNNFEFGHEDYYTEIVALENFKKTTEGLSVIALLGGEPMIIPDVITYLQAISDETASHCTISFNTNCSTFNEKVIKQTDRFSKVVLTLSIDGLDKNFEYIRRNGVWKEVEENIKKFYDLYLNDPNRYIINAIITTSVYNILHITEVAEYIMLRYPEIKCAFQKVIQPSMMTPGNIPDSVKVKALEKLNYFFKNKIKPPYKHSVWLQTEAKAVIKALNNHKFNFAQWEEFIEYTNTLDKVRPKPHFLDINPEFSPYWHD